MHERDLARKKVCSSAGERLIAMKKYKMLRNKVTHQIREENKIANGKKIDEANNESEYWNVINDINKPKTEEKWRIEDEDGITEVNEEIATKFNHFFINKIEGLKTNIDTNLKEDPLTHLTKKLEHKNLKFSLKTVSVKTVLKVMKKMKRKKSAGLDGVTQDCLLIGMDVLAVPLTHIINTSITQAKVPDCWKEAIVIPILKKGDSSDLNNDNINQIQSLMLTKTITVRVSG